jgi:hypothetical protein
MSGDNSTTTTTTTTTTVTTNTNVDQIAFHIDADKLGHGVYAPGSAALEEIGLAFGEGVIFNNGTVNRKALGSIVFNDENQMAVSLYSFFYCYFYSFFDQPLMHSLTILNINFLTFC